MKKVTITIYVLLCTIAVQAQTIKRSVIGAAGNTSTAGTVTVRSTTGETMTNKLTGNNAAISQGFQQGKLTVARIQDETEIEAAVKFNVFPNPVTDFVTIETLTAPEQVSTIVLTDINGKVLQQSILTDKQMQLSFETYASGTYIITVISEEKKESFRVIKK